MPPSNIPPYQMRQFPGQPLPGTDGNYETGSMFQNPAGTMPFPAPFNMPYAQWQSARTPLNWTNPGSLDAGYVTAAYWSSPLFDLRPEIKSADGSKASGVPIWGSGGRKLWVQVDGLLSVTDGVVATAELYVVSREYSNIFDPNQVQRVLADADISADWASGTNQPPSIILSFNPIGSGYSVRYWRCELAFRRLDRVTHPLAISAAFY